MKPVRIIVFAKAPEPGKVKTRLIPALGAEGAAALARRMLLHTLDTALAAQLGTVELCASPAPEDAIWREVALPPAIEQSAQGEGDLGQRLARGAQRAVAQGEAVMLIGSDCPALSAPLLRQAAQQLLQHEACMIPSLDGGYVLLGLRQFSLRLFEDIPWSSDSVASLTQARAAALGWAMPCLPALMDIDEPAELARLPPGWLSATP